ncbi:MAG: aminopeptidase P family protein [candidate division Zixibacteria bacterium]|nr:aminopeptidase P family protein [candidate division Zixibacteria bacterium]
MKAHIDKLKKFLVAENIDAAFVAILDVGETTSMPGVRWLTGYSGSTGGVFVTQKSATFISDFRYTEQAKKEVKGAKVLISKKPPIATLADLKAAQKKNLKVAIEAARLTIEQKMMIEVALPDAILIDCKNMLEDIAIIKDKYEIENLRQAAKISDSAFERILGFLRPGITEKEVGAELEYQMKMLGAEKEAFSTIVASGFRSAMPHGVASSKKLEKGDFITFDFGAIYNGYVSDMTRTVVLGKATTRQKKVYNTVLKAQMAGVKKVKAGVAGKAVDDVCRKIITKAGFGKNFGHGTGHGIGLEVHSGPRLSPISKDILKSGMVVTVEPGIYITGWGGVRIEDDVVVRPGGCTILNKSPKNLLEI